MSFLWDSQRVPQIRQKCQVSADTVSTLCCRALGDYAQQGGIKDATKLVDSFFLAVQGFDYTLFQAKRNNTPVKDDSEAALQKTLGALDTCGAHP